MKSHHVINVHVSLSPATESAGGPGPEKPRDEGPQVNGGGDPGGGSPWQPPPRSVRSQERGLRRRVLV